MPLQNPYPHEPGKVNHSVVGRVGHADYAYLKTLFPVISGLQDKLVSIFYKKLCDELRARGMVVGKDEAWSTDHPSIAVLESILSNVSFATKKPRKAKNG